MQCLLYKGAGPSSNTCPRCAPHRGQVTSILCIENELSDFKSMFLSDTGSVKLGHPQPESNLASDE